jgi:hypothetical protein
MRVTLLLLPFPLHVYMYIMVCLCYKIHLLLKMNARYILLVHRTCCILSCDFNVNNVFKSILCPSSVKVYYLQEILNHISSNVMKTMVFLVSNIKI